MSYKFDLINGIIEEISFKGMSYRKIKDVKKTKKIKVDFTPYWCRLLTTNHNKRELDFRRSNDIKRLVRKLLNDGAKLQNVKSILITPYSGMLIDREKTTLKVCRVSMSNDGFCIHCL